MGVSLWVMTRAIAHNGCIVPRLYSAARHQEDICPERESADTGR